jgi:hypothetical protein
VATSRGGGATQLYSLGTRQSDGAPVEEDNTAMSKLLEPRSKSCKMCVFITAGPITKPAMKPSGNHTSVASVAGRRRRSAESARAAGPRRWVGPRGGCALRGMRTGANGRRVPAVRGGGRRREEDMCYDIRRAACVDESAK